MNLQSAVELLIQSLSLLVLLHFKEVALVKKKIQKYAMAKIYFQCLDICFITKMFVNIAN